MAKFSLINAEDKIASAPSVVYWKNPEKTIVFSRNGTNLMYKCEEKDNCLH
jgi:hypothetical protein